MFRMLKTIVLLERNTKRQPVSLGGACAFIINAVSEAGVMPRNNTLASAVVIYSRFASGPCCADLRGAHRMVVLMCRADQDPISGRMSGRERTDTVSAVTEYLYITREMPRSTTWHGLVKASDRWHRRIDAQQNRQEWQERLRRNKGCYWV